MLKKLSIISFLAVLLVLPSQIFAQTVTVEPTTKVSAKTERAQAKEAFKTAKTDLKAELSAAKEAFKAKIAEIKDSRKKTLAEGIDAKIQNINETRTTQMLEHLDKLTLILNKVSTREAALKAEGKDTTLLLKKIADAKTAVDSAKLAVAAQSEKEYTAIITTEALLKNAFSTLLTKFRTDIKAVFEKALAAKKAVREAHVEAAQLMGEKAGKTTNVVTPKVIPTE